MSRECEPREKAIEVGDVHDPEEVRGMMGRLEGIRGEVVGLARSTAGERLRRRPGGKGWSALEHLRHLLFAEDLYINRWILRNATAFSAAGKLPAFLRKRAGFAGVGAEGSSDLEGVVGEWSRVHELTRGFLATATSKALARNTADVAFVPDQQGTVGHVLAAMAKHELHHLRKIEEAIGEGEGNDE